MYQHVQPVKDAARTDLSQDPARLRRKRREAGLSTRQLAEIAVLSAATVSYLERGVYSAEPGTLRKLADALGCEIADIMAADPRGSAA